MIFINFKTYPQASGENAIKLVRIACDVAETSGVEIISCPQTIDIREVIAASNHPVWTQHVDPFERGRATGWIPAEVAREMGAAGALLNHSEHKLSVGELSETLNRCNEVGLKTLVFADSTEEAKMIAKFSPDYIGYEPPELIASKETSVARSKPEVIEEVVKAIPNIPVLIGAGVKGREDVEVGLRLGAKGIVLSSAVVLAEDPKKILLELAEGFK